MRRLIAALSASFVLALSGCGGGGSDAGTSPLGNGPGTPTCPATPPASSASGTPSTPTTCVTGASVDVVASTVQVGSGGDTSTITAVVKTSGNVGLANASVSFSADTGTLTGASATTNAAGVATAVFSSGSDRSNRTATITVRSGSATGTIKLDIVGTQISYSGPTTVAAGSAITASVKLVDAKGSAIPNQTVTVASSLSNGLSATSLTTDSLGAATLQYTATNAGTDSLVFTGAGTSVTARVQVSAADFAFVSPAPNTSVPVGTPQVVRVRYLSSGVPQAGVSINFAATAGTVTPTSAVTDGTGHAQTSVTSSTASPAIVQASVSSSVQATLPIVFTAQQPANIVLQVSPTAIAPNPAGATAQQSQLIATVRDTNGNPVSGAMVNFTRLSDPSGGNLSQASAVTDSGGKATAQYIAGPTTTASNGVLIQASVSGGSSTYTATASLTVNQSALFIVLGTGNVISNLNPETYKKDWTVYVTDANGIAVPNVDLTIKVLPMEYLKGVLVFSGTSWVYETSTLQVCNNEDVNYNGILDPGEDFNGSGNLQPGNVISVTTSTSATPGTSGIARTDATGRATITLLYAENFAPWVRVKLVAQAIVSGTESSREAAFVVSGAADDFTNPAIPPAGRVSPFGTNSCSIPD